MDKLELAAFLASTPAIMFITGQIKQAVPDRFRAVVPLGVGVILGLGLSFYTGADMTQAVLAGLGMGGVASSVRDGAKDLRG